MSENVITAENQQGRPWLITGEPSETTRRTPHGKSVILAYLQGALHDATLNKGKRIRFAQKNRQWLELLQFLLNAIGCKSWIYKEGKYRDVYVLETLCKDLDFGFNPMQLVTKEEMRAYLRGFFDAEGGIPLNNGRFYIQLVQKNLQKMQWLKLLLGKIEIPSGVIHNPSKRIDPDYWRLFIPAEHHRHFAITVGSWHPVKHMIFCERMKI